MYMCQCCYRNAWGQQAWLNIPLIYDNYTDERKISKPSELLYMEPKVSDIHIMMIIENPSKLYHQITRTSLFLRPFFPLRTTIDCKCTVLVSPPKQLFCPVCSPPPMSVFRVNGIHWAGFPLGFSLL